MTDFKDLRLRFLELEGSTLSRGFTKLVLLIFLKGEASTLVGNLILDMSKLTFDEF